MTDPRKDSFCLVLGRDAEPCWLFQRPLDFLNAFFHGIENSNPPGRVGILGSCAFQFDRTWAVIQVVDVDDFRVRVLNVRYGEGNRLRRLKWPRLKCSDKADNRDGKCNRH